MKNIQCGHFSYLIFTEGNEIVYYQDHNWFKGIPSGMKFFIDKISIHRESVWLAALGYGMLTDNKFGYPHNYGNGKVNVAFSELDAETVEFCKQFAEVSDKIIF